MTRALLFAAAFLTTACGSMPGLTGAGQKPVGGLSGPTGELTCPAEDYQSFVGEPLAAVTYPSNLRVRVIEPDTVVTMDYVATRMNIHVDKEGTVTRVICG